MLQRGWSVMLQRGWSGRQVVNGPVHKTHVSALLVDVRMGRVYTGDGDGVIWVWRRDGRGDGPGDFHPHAPLVHAALRQRPVTSLALHPMRKRAHLLVHAHGNVLMLLDTSNKAALVTYHGSQCRTSRIRAVFSPDGRFVVAGSEEGHVMVWEAKTGARVHHSLARFSFNAPLLDVSWHPTQHCLALASGGGPHPVLVTFAVRAAPGLDDEAKTVAEAQQEAQAEQAALKETQDRRKKVKDRLAKWQAKRAATQKYLPAIKGSLARSADTENQHQAANQPEPEPTEAEPVLALSEAGTTIAMASSGRKFPTGDPGRPPRHR